MSTIIIIKPYSYSAGALFTLHTESRCDILKDMNEGESPKRSLLAEKVEELRSSSVEYVRNRSRVPQPLFWHAFGAQIRSIKRQKEAERTIKELLEEGLG